ncbi:MAG TPA: FHA domain-containing protein [Actinomycetota bacterium]|nr:FHA domain-containing protein [Actinomycetota bacterium]
MPDIVLDILKYVFLAVLYIFVARAVRAVMIELRPSTASASAVAAPTKPSSRKAKRAPRRAAIVEGGSTSGKNFDLDQELTIGRADKCHVVLDDTYVSQVHARIFARNGSYYIEDLGSTNGTYLNRKRVAGATELQRGDRVKIGKTVLEMRR